MARRRTLLGPCTALCCLALPLASAEVTFASATVDNRRLVADRRSSNRHAAVLDSTGSVIADAVEKDIAGSSSGGIFPTSPAALSQGAVKADALQGTSVRLRPPALSSLAGRWWLNRTSIGVGAKASSTGSLSDQLGFVVPDAFKKNNTVPNWEAYPEYALKASQDDSIFAGFRQVYAERQYAGIDSPRYGKAYVQETIKRLRERDVPNVTDRAKQVAAAVDSVGQPSVYPLWEPSRSDKDQPPANISGLTARYLKFALDVERLFGNLSGFDVIELGVGFGGQASVLLSMFPDINSYTLVDLPEVLHMADKFINQTAPLDTSMQLGQNVAGPRLKFLSGDTGIEPEQHYHLLISTFAYTEVPLQLRQEYFDKIVRRADHGFVADNSASTKSTYGDFSAAALPLQLLMGGVPGEDLLVFPLGLPSTPDDDPGLGAVVAWNVVNEYFPKAFNGVADTPDIHKDYPVRKLRRNCNLKFHGRDMAVCDGHKK
eukprot:TRINITY_DN92350_c0_g1_i1.p1 TRINITY_DN92350_c0_g1~~TRINITY_DN92350_c0_g1_i1.p1  ORF type:complete len:509 (+),score=104.54 TRINITY_DN92350_c0_g1_i1:64-1527(+)